MVRKFLNLADARLKTHSCVSISINFNLICLIKGICLQNIYMTELLFFLYMKVNNPLCILYVITGTLLIGHNMHSWLKIKRIFFSKLVGPMKRDFVKIAVKETTILLT